MFVAVRAMVTSLSVVEESLFPINGRFFRMEVR